MAIPAAKRLIHALDVPDAAAARAHVERLGDTVHFYKVGLELFLCGDGFALVDWLLARKRQVFLDLKLFDVPATVGRAVRQLQGRGIHFVTVHGNDAMLEAAVQEKQDTGILAVTALTSLDRSDLTALGFACDVPQLVLSRAQRALAIGCDGVVSSGLEAVALREDLGTGFLVITPGIRPVDNQDDQKRTVDVRTAFQNGADYIVVGRPIRDAADPAAAAAAIQQSIRQATGAD